MSIIFSLPSTNVIYVDKDDNYSIRAKEDLASGALVLIEHMVSSKDARDIMSALESDDHQDMCKDLCPRTKSSNITEKMYQNMFYFAATGIYAIGPRTSKFNHSCIANCAIQCIDQESSFYAIWTVRPVKKGQELTLDYANSPLSDFHDKLLLKLGIQCDCVKKSEKEKRIEVKQSIIKQFLSINKEFIDTVCANYKTKQI